MTKCDTLLALESHFGSKCGGPILCEDWNCLKVNCGRKNVALLFLQLQGLLWSYYGRPVLGENMNNWGSSNMSCLSLVQYWSNRECCNTSCRGEQRELTLMLAPNSGNHLPLTLNKGIVYIPPPQTRLWRTLLSSRRENGCLAALGHTQSTSQCKVDFQTKVSEMMF